jgi:hypothetical protein
MVVVIEQRADYKAEVVIVVTNNTAFAIKSLCNIGHTGSKGVDVRVLSSE